LKALQVSTDDDSGGASRSAYRLHQALLEQSVDGWMRVLRHDTANSRVRDGRPNRTLQKKILDRLIRKSREFSNRNWHTDNPILHSFGQASAGLLNEINQDPAQIVNLHWVTDLLSIKDIGAICKPLVWTVHDMWPFCGGEHSTPDKIDARFRTGYLESNRPSTERGPDLNRQAWDEKKSAWHQKSITFIAPSQWMSRCIGESALFKNEPICIHVIPNPLPMDLTWRPVDKRRARASLGLDSNKKYLLAGSAGGMSSIKGEDMLTPIMDRIVQRYGESVELIIFGRRRAVIGENWPIKVHWMGQVKSDSVMASLYSAADVMLVPSRQDNLPNTAVEAQACGTPVAAFHIGGLPDIVEHGVTGWLAPPFDLDHFAHGISWLLEDRERYLQIADRSRDVAVHKFDANTIAKKYIEVYEKILCEEPPVVR
jgi:glycosyltransferase involved in cell wall biosynthesis